MLIIVLLSPHQPPELHNLQRRKRERTMRMLEVFSYEYHSTWQMWLICVAAFNLTRGSYLHLQQTKSSYHNLELTIYIYVILSIGVDAKKAGRDAPPAFAVKVDHSHPEVTRFYCNTEQAYLTEATWVHFTGCLYFLPKLFAVPAFRPVLESLFPDPSLALTYLLRTLMIPNDGIWEQVKQQDNALFANVDRRVGIQVRGWHFSYISNILSFNLMHRMCVV
jgi:hypothetical protein